MFEYSETVCPNIAVWPHCWNLRVNVDGSLQSMQANTEAPLI